MGKRSLILSYIIASLHYNIIYGKEKKKTFYQTQQ